MNHPATALLWECWRLTRYGIAIRLSIGIIVGVSCLVLFESFAVGENIEIGMLVVALTISLGCALSAVDLAVSIKPGIGFPFYLGFARPISTLVLTWVPMIYFSLTCAALYLVPVVIFRSAFDLLLPLLPVSVLIIVFTLVIFSCNWWTTDKTRQTISMICMYFGATSLFYNHFGGSVDSFDPKKIKWIPGSENWSNIPEFSLASWGLVLATVVAAMVVAAIGVESQRRGDTAGGSIGGIPTAPDNTKHIWQWDWFTRFYRAACPTTSPIQAELWLELKCRGIPVLGIGLLVAAAIPLFLITLDTFASTGMGMAIAEVGLVVLIGLAFSTLLPLFSWSTQTFGIKRKQGTLYMAAFYATRALGTAHLCWLKIIVMTLSLLLAWTVIGSSMWLSSPLIENVHDYQQLKTSIAEFFEATPATQILAGLIVGLAQFATLVALIATLQTLYVFYPRPILWGWIAFSLYILLLAISFKLDWVSSDVIVIHAGLANLTILTGIACVYRIVLKDQIVTPKQLVFAISGWVIFLIAYLFLLDSGANPRSGSALVYLSWFTLLGLLPLVAVAVAPWSFALLRHQ